jgi:hypothetical protein
MTESATAAARYERLSVMTVPMEIDDGMPTERAAASTADQPGTSRRAMR